MAQEKLVVEWLWSLQQAREFLLRAEVPQVLRLASESLLDQLESFAMSGSLASLERGLGALEGLAPQWDHWAAVAERRGSPWTLENRPAPFEVSRQFGRHRILWRCADCGWEWSYSVPSQPWEQICWPGEFSCPCCSASNDDLNPGESLLTESEE